MGNFLKIVFDAVIIRFIGIVARIRLLLSPTWWKTQGFSVIRDFFAKLFDVKPKNQKDYYTILGWMISKKLAFALTVVIGVLSLYYLLVLSPIAPKPSDLEAGNLPIYNYNSIPLRFAKGAVQIKAKKGYIAYIGDVEKGQVKGMGKLYDQNGALVYDGGFDKNMFNNAGVLYYPTGELKYNGDFADNLYHGEGRQYRLAGSLEYEGGFTRGERDGLGILYNASGTQIYEGTFQMGNILYNELIGKSTVEISEMYTGLSNVCSYFDEYCVEMSEIGAVYSVDGGQDTLEAEWIVKNVTVVDDSIWVGSQRFSEIEQLTGFFGAPDYFGEAWVNLSEAVATNMVVGKEAVGKVAMEKSAVFDDVFEVTDYDRDFSVYVFAYKFDGLLYTFYCANSYSPSFFMYSITTD